MSKRVDRSDGEGRGRNQQGRCGLESEAELPEGGGSGVPGGSRQVVGRQGRAAEARGYFAESHSDPGQSQVSIHSFCLHKELSLFFLLTAARWLTVLATL